MINFHQAVLKASRLSSLLSRLQAGDLSRKIFGSASLKSHFSIERWGGCNPKIIDEVEEAGRAGLMHFGYATWRQLAAEQEAAAVASGTPMAPRGCSVGASQIQVPGVPGGGEPSKSRKGKRGRAD